MLYIDLPFSFSYLALYTFCKTKKTQNVINAGLIKDVRFVFGWMFQRQPYPTDKLLDLLAVGSVTSLGQGGEGATLHFLLAGLLVFALEIKNIIHTSIMKVVFSVICSLLTEKCFHVELKMVDLLLMRDCAQTWRGGSEECPGQSCIGPLPFHTCLCISPEGWGHTHSV